jgi:hypothetical protein
MYVQLHQLNFTEPERVQDERKFFSGTWEKNELHTRKMFRELGEKWDKGRKCFWNLEKNEDRKNVSGTWIEI